MKGYLSGKEKQDKDEPVTCVMIRWIGWDVDLNRKKKKESPDFEELPLPIDGKQEKFKCELG